MRYTFILLLPLLFLSGCSESSRPSDLPPLFPCTVSVTQGGGPLAGAYVELVSPDSPKYRPSAATDESGNAAIMTYGYPGAPVGKYKIIVRKSIEDDIVMGKDEYGEDAVVSSNRYSVVADIHGDASRSPHEVEVTASSKGVQTTIDVGDAIRVRVPGSN